LENKLSYVGDLDKHGRKEGQGKLKEENGVQYDGTFKEDKKHGYGI
jgi:hypothetical protein